MRFQSVMKRWPRATWSYMSWWDRLEWRIFLMAKAARNLFVAVWIIFMMLGAAFIMAYAVSELLNLLGLTIV